MGQTTLGGGALVVRPRHKRQALAGLLWLSLAGLSALNTDWGGPGRHVPSFATAAFLVLASARLAPMLLGVPRLTIGPDGVALRTLFRRKALAWGDVGPFALTSSHRTRTKRLRIVAPIVRSGSIPGVARRSFIIPDAFQTPLPAIMAELARRQGATEAEIQGLRIAGPPEAELGVTGFRWPWLSTGLVAAMIAVFVLEQSLGMDPPAEPLTPSLGTLIALGGLSRTLALSGQWWRMLTTAFLHASLLHLVANSVTLLFAGYALERFAGRYWTLCIFILGGLGGAVGSILLNAPDTLTVGASGAIMAMVVAVFVMSFHLPAGPAKHRMLFESLRVAIPSLIPVAQGAGAMHVDYGAHAGGAAFGALLGLSMLVTWQDGSPLPSMRGVISLIAAAGVAACGLSSYAVARNYRAYARWGPLIPATQYPKPAEVSARADQLLAAYPNDPRAAMLAALTQTNRGRPAEAERLMRLAVANAEGQSWRFKPSFVSNVQSELAAMLSQEGKRREAEALARQTCGLTGAAAVSAAVREQLTRAGLCAEAARSR